MNERMERELQSTLALMEQKLPQPQRKKAPRRALALTLAVVLVLGLTVGAGAAGLFGPVSELFAPVFENIGANSQVAEKIGQLLEASATDNGITVSVDGIVGDPSGCALVFSFHGKGVEENNFGFREIRGDGVLFGRSGTYERLTDDVAGDDTVRYVYNISYVAVDSDDTLKTGRGSITFVDLVGHPMYPEWNVKGQWTLDVDVEYEDSSVKLPVEPTINVEGRDVAFHDLTVSPLSFSYRFNIDVSDIGKREYGNLDLTQSEMDDFVDLYSHLNVMIVTKDGQRYVGGRAYSDFDVEYIQDQEYNLLYGRFANGDIYLGSHTSELDPANNGSGYTRIPFEHQIIMPEDIESITIEGVEVYRAE